MRGLPTCPATHPLQMLVYENYNKFVTATDTIKVMNSSMGGMDTNMNTLKGLIGGCAEWLFVDTAVAANSVVYCVRPPSNE